MISWGRWASYQRLLWNLSGILEPPQKRSQLKLELILGYSYRRWRLYQEASPCRIPIHYILNLDKNQLKGIDYRLPYFGMLWTWFWKRFSMIYWICISVEFGYPRLKMRTLYYHWNFGSSLSKSFKDHCIFEHFTKSHLWTKQILETWSNAPKIWKKWSHQEIQELCKSLTNDESILAQPAYLHFYSTLNLAIRY